MGDQNLATMLSQRYSTEQHRTRIEAIDHYANSIVRNTVEPEAKITEIALAVIMDFVDISLEPKSKGRKIAERIDQAMEKTTELYASMQNPCAPWQLRLGLLRGQDAIFGGSRVVSERSTIEDEISKLNGIIERRLERRKEQLTAQRKSAKRKRPVKSNSTSTPQKPAAPHCRKTKQSDAQATA